MTANWMLTCWYSSTTSGCKSPACTMASECTCGCVVTTQASGPYALITLGIICIPLQHEAAINSCSYCSFSCISRTCWLQNWNINAVAAHPDWGNSWGRSVPGVLVIVTGRVGTVYGTIKLTIGNRQFWNRKGRRRRAIIVERQVRTRSIRKEVEIYAGINDRTRANRVQIIRPSNCENPRRVIDFKDSVIHVRDFDQRDIIAAVYFKIWVTTIVWPIWSPERIAEV